MNGWIPVSISRVGKHAFTHEWQVLGSAADAECNEADMLQACSYMKGMWHIEVSQGGAGQQLPQGNLGLPGMSPRRCNLGCSSWRRATGKSRASQGQRLHSSIDLPLDHLQYYRLHATTVTATSALQYVNTQLLKVLRFAYARAHK